MKLKTTEVNMDLVVCGGGMPGICAAIQAARLGLSVALINNRGFLGGNASPEIRVTISGATGTSEFNLYSREGGIIDELLVENRYRNPQGNAYLWYTVIIDALKAEKNIQVFNNTNIDTVNMDVVNTQKIVSVEGSQVGSEKHFLFTGKQFLDDTGDGTIGYLAGADYMRGREAKSKWNERIAPTKADNGGNLSTLSFYTKDFHRPMGFKMPEFAKDEKAIFEKALKYRQVPERKPNDSRYDGYRMQWFYEVGAGRDQISDDEEIIADHTKLIMNIWDHIKHEANYDSKNFDFEYISSFPGKRESRRIVGDYILTENDIEKQTDFEDAIAYGGWSIDLHADGGFYSGDLINRHYYLNGIYQIPFRSCYAKNIDNLLVASRCMSVSHIAHGTTRLMQTLATVGQACAVAAFVCIKNNLKTSEITAKKHIHEVQQILLDNDQYIPCVKKDPSDISDAKITASSTFNGVLETVAKGDKYYNQLYSEPIQLINGMALVFPAVKENNKLVFNVLADCDTEVVYTIYSPSKKENYNPGTILGQYKVLVTASKSVQPVIFNLGKIAEDGNLFMEIEKNKNIRLEVVKDSISGWKMFNRKSNENDSLCDINTLNKKRFFYMVLDVLPTFSYLSENYNADNMNNGYIRNNEGKPNMWLSDRISDKPEEIIINLPKETSRKVLNITFNAFDPEKKYDNFETIYKKNVWTSVVKDYDVFCDSGDGVWEKVASICENYKKVNTILLDSNNKRKIKLVLHSCNGGSRYGIYDISLK